MRLLWVKAGKLLPVDTGGKIRSYNLLRQLAARHDVTVLTYYDGPRDPAYEADMASRFRRAVTLSTGFPETRGTAGTWRYVRHLGSPVPFAVEKFRSAEVARLVAGTMTSGDCDVAVCDFLSASRNFPDELTAPALLFQHNVESTLWDRQARHERNPVKRLAYTYEAARMTRYERSAVQRFHHVVAVSDHDRALMTRWVDPARVSVVPTGVDVAAYSPAAQGAGGEDRSVLFLGSMDWEPNVDGVEWFCAEIWPRIRAAVPDAKFRIVGRNPAARVTRLASEAVEVTGTVPSVVEYLRNAAVFVVPLRVGGGTRLKIFEAMAAGRAVVSTAVGAEGLDVENGRDLILENTPAAFADAVVSVLRDIGLRRQLSAAAVRVASRFDWSAVVERFEDALEAARARAGHPGAAAAATP